jgi:hypothetical protein
VAISTELILNASQQDELVAISQSRSLPAGYGFCNCILRLLGFSRHDVQATIPNFALYGSCSLVGLLRLLGGSG